MVVVVGFRKYMVSVNTLDIQLVVFLRKRMDSDHILNKFRQLAHRPIQGQKNGDKHPQNRKW